MLFSFLSLQFPSQGAYDDYREMHEESWGTHWPASESYIWSSRNVLHIKHGLGVRAELMGIDLRDTQLILRRFGDVWLKSSKALFEKDSSTDKACRLRSKIVALQVEVARTPDPARKRELRSKIRKLQAERTAKVSDDDSLVDTKHLRSCTDEQHWFRGIRRRIIPDEMWCWLVHPQFHHSVKAKGALAGYPSSVMGYYLEAWEGERTSFVLLLLVSCLPRLANSLLLLAPNET
jgi:hypothetical protein